MNHVFSSYGCDAASTRVRVLDWIDYTGVQAEFHSYIPAPNNSISSIGRHLFSAVGAEAHARGLSRKLLSSMRVLISRRATPFGHGGLEQRLLGASAHGVYDFDDAIMIGSAGLHTRISDSRAVWRNCVTNSEVVIAGNAVLAEIASEFASDIRVIPSCVDEGRYRQKVQYEISDPGPEIVWVGSPSTEKYLKTIGDVLLELNRTRGATLKVISSPIGNLGKLEQIVTRLSWKPGLVESTLSQSDIGIMPLSEGFWERGKCAFKLIQYGAAGLPTVGSPVGENSRFQNLAGAPAPSSKSDWYDALIGLIDGSVEDRRLLGIAGRRITAEHYSFSAWKDEWLLATLFDARLEKDGQRGRRAAGQEG